MPESKTSLNELLYEIRRVSKSREVLTEKKIEKIYQSLEKSLKTSVGEAFEKYADNDGRLYTAYLDSQRKKAWFLNEIIKNVDNIEPSVKAEITELIDKTYESCYKGMADSVKKADTAKKLEEVTKDIAVQPDVLKSAVNNNISKLTLPQIMEKHRAEIVYQLQQELTMGLANGDRYETMVKRITERCNVSTGKAKNIVRTEAHRNVESGFIDCAERLSEGLDDYDLIYACTWCTMQDERVRPQVRRKTKKGWVTKQSKSGANHIVMDGKTVKVGELFDLGYYKGRKVEAKAPSKSGVAAHDCNCRCFLEYNLLTVEEFADLTNQTPEQVRKKYNMSVKEKGLTKSEKSDIIKLPKSMENFDEYQKQWVDEKFYMPKKKKQALENGIKKVIDNNDFSMRINSRDLESIIKGGFKNQLETETSGGMLSKQYRLTANKRLFNADTMNLKPSEFEKYGYLGSKDLLEDAKTSATRQYGKTIVKFNKARLKDRVTYTLDDSLGNALHGEVIGGKIGDKCSISGIPLYNADVVIDYFEESDLNDIYNADSFAQIVGCRYFELQFHGKLTIDDVDSICFTRTDKASEEIINQLKEKGIKVFSIKGGVLNDL